MACRPFSTPRNITPVIALLSALCLAIPVSGQKLMELRLKDGRVLVGDVSTKGANYEVETRDGHVTVTQLEVASRRLKKELQDALRKKAGKSGDTAFAHLNLAKQAADYGLKREMWLHIEKALEKLPPQTGGESNPVQRRLREFLGQRERDLLPRELGQAPIETRIKAILRQFNAATGNAKAAALQELLVREPNADQPLRQFARKSTSERQRIAALSALQRREVSGNDRFVLRTTVLDRSKNVRSAAAEIGKPEVTSEDISYMASGFAHANAKVRIRTAIALGNLGHRDAIPLLVKAAPHAGAGLAASGDASKTRGHVAFLEQRSYIRDFDVEVASAAFIADPQVDVLQSGTVLDVTVAGVTQIRTILKVYRISLKQLSGLDPGADTRRWPEWLLKLPPQKNASKTGKR